MAKQHGPGRGLFLSDERHRHQLDDRGDFMAIDEYAHVLEIPTRWNDNDVYGHVNNVHYYSFFDTVINTYLIDEGGLDIYEGSAIGLCVESHCVFRSPLAFPAVVRAGLRVATIGRSSVRYEVGLFSAPRDDESAEGWFVHVFVDRRTRRPAPIPQRVRTALTLLTTSTEANGTSGQPR
jgi:acyl-CoA thioester hydrolase